jgi:antirestriction protein ArdC
LKAYTVFHASQIEGIEFPHPRTCQSFPSRQKTDRAREIVAAMPNAPAIQTGAAVPCYRPKTDSVHMPERAFLRSEEAYYSTLFHELSHSTGHASRLARKSLLENKGIDADGDTARKVYAEEELVAEMGASFLNAHAGIMEDELSNSAAYLQSWIDALKARTPKAGLSALHRRRRRQPTTS